MTDQLGPALTDNLDLRRLLGRLADLDDDALQPLASRLDGLRARREQVMDSAAAYLGLTRDALWKRTRGGEIASAQDGPGCKLFYRRSDLDAYVDERRRVA